jgi:hypothetical protein
VYSGQLHTFSVSAKRYALYTLDGDDSPTVAGATGHGRGQLIGPEEALSTEEREEAQHAYGWQLDVWRDTFAQLCRRRLAGNKHRSRRGKSGPAVTRVTVSTFERWRVFEKLNAGKSYTDCIKPFNFLIAAQIDPLGFPTDPDHFRLIAPFESDPKRWTRTNWYNLYDECGTVYRIRTGTIEHVAPTRSSSRATATWFTHTVSTPGPSRAMRFG